ncbi:MAG: hypothetical protein RL020_1510 [Pseudomonadota bacterium]|jgi:uncharacterized protein
MSLTETLSIGFGNVMHSRMRPRAHRFHYGVFYLRLPLSQYKQTFCPFFSVDKWNLLSLYRGDHGAKDGSDLETWMRDLLERENIQHADGEIILQAFPRVLGYVFNPISFWFCHDKQGALRAVLCEVRNTFGEHHNYLVAHEDGRPIASDCTLQSRKVFHVSPFFDVAGDYRFGFSQQGETQKVRIDYYDAQGLLLATNVSGRAEPLTSKRILFAFFRYPLMTFGVVARIHWQALKLWRKGAGYRSKPAPPALETTR